MAGAAGPSRSTSLSLHYIMQRQGVVGFADSRNKILLPVCYAIKAMQHQPTETWVKAVVLLETIDFENYLLLLILTQVCEEKTGNAVNFAIHVLGGIGEAKSIRS